MLIPYEFESVQNPTSRTLDANDCAPHAFCWRRFLRHSASPWRSNLCHSAFFMRSLLHSLGALCRGVASYSGNPPFELERDHDSGPDSDKPRWSNGARLKGVEEGEGNWASLGGAIPPDRFPSTVGASRSLAAIYCCRSRKVFVAKEPSPFCIIYAKCSLLPGSPGPGSYRARSPVRILCRSGLGTSCGRTRGRFERGLGVYAPGDSGDRGSMIQGLRAKSTFNSLTAPSRIHSQFSPKNPKPLTFVTVNGWF